jgi:hypothetical protein
MRNDVELVDACLSLLRVGNRETLDALFDEDIYDPLGCGCCAYTPGVYHQFIGDVLPTDGFVKDKEWVIWRAEDGSWKERDER